MTGTGIGFDFSQLMTQFAKLDAELKKLTASGKTFGDSMKAVFAGMTKGDFKNFASQIKQLRGDVVAFGKVKVGLNWDSTSLQNYINDVNRLILVIKQVREGAKGSHELKGTGISIQGLKKELKDAQELLAIVKKVEQQTKRSTYDRYTSYAGATNYSNNAVSIEQNAKAVEYLTAARNKLKTTDADYLTKLEDLNTRIQKHNEILHRSKQTNKEAADEAKKTAEATKRANDQMLRTPSQLVGMKGSAKTMNELRLYAEQLRKTMNTLNPKSAEWKKLNGILQQTEKQISRVENKMKGLNGIAGTFKNALSGVGRMVATAFAVERVWQFAKSIVSVTGEFEQMKVALGSMVGNLEKTNRLWEQTMELAKNSPFQARELVKYTRQLAAYRIETDKLHKTTKMLADVSAGLGVDMSRLILAYGQVRAAEYLRGTELRQFTEAGVPMLEELAKHFSELEGHAVSTAKVFDMISKRQVTFSDVSDVLERMTEEGGPFYKMQEVMSDTIKGSISNLKDEIDLMMYEIGQDNDGVIKGMLNLLRSLVRNWEYVGATIKTVTVAMLSYTVATKAAAATSSLASLRITSFARALAVTRRALRSAETAVKGFISSLGPIGWAVTIISTLITAVLSYRAARRDANKEDEKAAELAGELKAIDKQYSELTRSVERYKDAFNKASDSGNLSEMEVQLTRLIELAKEKYSIVFNVKIEGATEEELKAEFSRVSSALSEAGIFSRNFQKAFEEKDPYREGGEYSLFVKEAEMLDHWEQEYTKIKEHVEQLLKNDDTKDLFRRYEPNEDPLAYMREYYEARYKLAKQDGVKLDEKAMTALNSLHYLEKLRKAYVEEIKKKVGGKGHWGDELSLNLGAALTGLIDRDQIDERATKAWEEAMASVFEVDDVSVHIDDGMDDWEVRFNEFIEKRRKKTTEAIKKAGLDDEAELGDSFRLEGSVVALLNEDNTKTRAELAKYLKEQRDIQKDIIDAIATGAKAYSEVEKAAAEIKYNELDAAIKYLVGDSGEKDKKNKALKILNNRIDLVKKMHKQYVDEYKTFGYEAKDAVSKAYKKAFEDAFQGTGVEFSGLVIDKDKLTELQNAGNEAGEAFSEAMLAKMAEVAEKGTYIRDITADAIDLLREHEDIRNQAYQDSGGVWTIGMGQTFNWKENRPVQEGDYWTDEEILMYSQEDIAEKRGWLNDVLDLHKDILITQEQYNQLFNATWQGGKGSTSALFKYAKDAEAFKGWLEELDNMPIVKVLLDDKGNIKERRQVGLWDIDVDAEIKKFNELESVYDRLALVMNYISVRDAKNRDTTQSMMDRAKSRADAFRGDLSVVKLLQKSSIDVSKIDFTNVEGVVDILKQLMPIAKKEGNEAVLALEEAIAGFQAEVGLTAKKDADKAIVDKVQKYLNEYDLVVELKKLNISPELAKNLFDVDYINLDGLKTKVVEEFAKGSKDGAEKVKTELNKNLLDVDWSVIKGELGEDQANEVKKTLEEIDKLVRKQREDDAKEFAKFLKNNLDEIKIIQDKGAYNISLSDKLYGEGKITADEYVSAIRRVVADTNSEVEKINLEKFKESSLYIKAMGNLAAYSRDELTNMMNTLKTQLATGAPNMGADEIKEYYDAITNLVEQYDKLRGPFQENEIAKIKEYYSQQKALNDARKEENSLEAQKLAIEQEIAALKAQLETQTKAGEVDNAKVTQENIKNKVADLQNINGQLVSVSSNVTVISEKIANLGDGMVEWLIVTQGIVNEISNVANASTEIFNSVKDIFSAYGADTDSGGWAKASTAMEMVGGVTGDLTSGLSALASGNIAGAISAVVGMVAKLVTGFAKIHDQKYVDEIERQTKEVEKLSKGYEELEALTEQAFSITHLREYNKELEENIDLQIAAYDAMIKAEEAKKKTDQAQIDAWNDEIDELRKQKEEAKKEAMESVGAIQIEDYRSQTRAFVDAWVSAFKETGDGLSGLEENFGEFFDNIIAEQASLRLTDKFLEPFYKNLNDYLKDLELTTEESKSLREQADAIMPELSAALEQIWTSLGGGKGETSGSLSELQKGIQGVTEETAQVLESLLNSMRLYVADTNMHIKDQTDYIKKMWKMMDDSVTGSSPFYVQMKNI